mgnify:FL=1
MKDKDRARCYACKRVYVVSYPSTGDGLVAVLRTHFKPGGRQHCEGSHSPVGDDDYIYSTALPSAPEEGEIRCG